MNLGNLGSVLNMLSLAVGTEGGRSRRQIIISAEKEKLILPVTPAKYNVTAGQQNKIVNIVQLGEILIFGMPQLRKLSFSCFFPAVFHDYPFVVGDDKKPEECIELITKWKEMRKPVRVIITDSPVNMAMGIQSFNYYEQDGSRDIYYELSFVEYKDLNTPLANNAKQIKEETGLKERAENEENAKAKSKLAKGADLLDKAKKLYGDYSKWRSIVQSHNLKDLAINNISKLNKLVK